MTYGTHRDVDYRPEKPSAVKIIRHLNQINFEELLNAAIRAGWTPLGPMTVHGGALCQMMAKYDSRDSYCGPM